MAGADRLDRASLTTPRPARKAVGLLSVGHHAADPPVAAVVFGQRPGHGGDPDSARADSKSQQGAGSGLRIANASSALMSCITACIPARIEPNPASRNRLRAVVRSVAMAPAPLSR